MHCTLFAGEFLFKQMLKKVGLVRLTAGEENLNFYYFLIIVGLLIAMLWLKLLPF